MLISIIKRLTAHIAFLLALLLYGFYAFFTPWYLFEHNITSIAGLTYSSYFDDAGRVYLGGSAAFIASYVLLDRFVTFGRSSLNPQFVFTKNHITQSLLVLYTIILCFLGYILTYSGVSLTELVDLKNSNTYLNLFGKQLAFPFADRIPDFLLLPTLLLFIAKPKFAWPILVLTTVIFIAFGFRYRVILLYGAIWLTWFVQPKLLISYPQSWIRSFLISTLFVGFFVIGLLTVNRLMLSARLFNKLTFDLSLLDTRLLVNETNNAQAFMRVLAYRGEAGISFPPLLNTTLACLVERFIPAVAFSDGIKPKPQLLIDIQNAFSSTPAGQTMHPAVTNMEEYYLDWGYTGLFICMGLFSFLCLFIGRITVLLFNTYYFPVGILLSVFVFQIISRGYMPQQVDILFSLIAPLAVLYLWHYSIRTWKQTRA
jgi:hypothetical protein